MPTQSSSDGDSIPDHRIATVSNDLERVVGLTVMVGFDWAGLGLWTNTDINSKGKRRNRKQSATRGIMVVVAMEIG